MSDYDAPSDRGGNLSQEVQDDYKFEKAASDSSRLFVTQSPSPNREPDDEALHSSKRARHFQDSGVRAYGHGSVKPYTLGTPYRYAIHEALPDLDVNKPEYRSAKEKLHIIISLHVLTVLLLYKDEDKEIGDVVDWLTNNATVPPIDPIRFAFFGKSGSGKSSTVNMILGIVDLVNASSSLESVTQVAQVFAFAVIKERYRATIFFMNKLNIEKLLQQCVNDILEYVRLSEQEGDERADYMNHVSTHAEAGRQVLVDLFSLHEDIDSLDDVQGFLEERSLFPDSGTTAPDTAIDQLVAQVHQRMALEGVDLSEHQKVVTADNEGELQAKLNTFSERGALAPIVEWIQTDFRSPLLEQDIEIVDLPGMGDTNKHTETNSKKFSDSCPRTILIANMERATTTPELDAHIQQTVRQKGGENVLMIFRGRETPEKSRSRWSKEEISDLKELEKELQDAQNQEQIDSAAMKILEHKNTVRDRFLGAHFTQKKFRDRRGTPMTIMTASNSDHCYYLNGKTEATLSIEGTGIPKIRRFLCQAPSDKKVEVLATHLSDVIRKLQRLRIWCDGPQMIRRDAAMALFVKMAKVSLGGYADQMDKFTDDAYEALLPYCSSELKKAAQNRVEAWKVEHKPRTVGAIITKWGRFEPKPKKSEQAKKVSFTGDLLAMTEVHDKFGEIELSMVKKVDLCQSAISGVIRSAVKKLQYALENSDQIGCGNMENVFQFFAQETDACIRDVKRSCDQLKSNIRSTIDVALNDEPADNDSPIFVREMDKHYRKCVQKIPKGTKKITEKRLEFLQERFASRDGPFHKLAGEVRNNLKKDFTVWIKEAEGCINLMFKELHGVLFRSFEGKRMSDNRRAQVSPEIRMVVQKAIDDLEAEFQAYQVAFG